MDLTGQIFNRLTVLSHARKNEHGQFLWLCICNCSNKNEVTVMGGHLRSGHTQSCGCLRLEAATKSTTTHGMSGKDTRTKEYRCWANMKTRCYNSHIIQYQDYGGRGIKVCDHWRNSFENFFKDMGKAPSSNHSIERIDNDSNYQPGNCKWVTDQEQANNKRDNRMIGNQTLAEICREKDLPYSIVNDRINKLNWSIEKALNTPVMKRNKKHN